MINKCSTRAKYRQNKIVLRLRVPDAYTPIYIMNSPTLVQAADGFCHYHAPQQAPAFQFLLHSLNYMCMSVNAH